MRRVRVRVSDPRSEQGQACRGDEDPRSQPNPRANPNHDASANANPEPKPNASPNTNTAPAPNTDPSPNPDLNPNTNTTPRIHARNGNRGARRSLEGTDLLAVASHGRVKSGRRAGQKAALLETTNQQVRVRVRVRVS